MNCTDKLKDLTIEQRITVLKELILWMEENGWHSVALKTKNQLERLRQSQRCSERA